VVFEIAVDGDGRDLVLLRDWLIASPPIRRAATVRLSAPAAVPGAMGSTAELITVAAGTLPTSAVWWWRSRVGGRAGARSPPYGSGAATSR